MVDSQPLANQKAPFLAGLALRELRDEPRRAEQRGAILGLVSESRVLGSARSRKLNRFSDSARLGREAKTAARMRLGRDEPRRAPSALGSFAALTLCVYLTEEKKDKED